MFHGNQQYQAVQYEQYEVQYEEYLKKYEYFLKKITVMEET
jgi:hypothetical protein